MPNNACVPALLNMILRKAQLEIFDELADDEISAVETLKPK